MPAEYDFSGLAARLLSSAETHLQQWLPGGKRVGHKYECADLRGGKGRSLKVDLQHGYWKDFASGESGGDLVDLYARVRGIDLGPAFRELSQGVGFVQSGDYTPAAPTPDPDPETGPPPSEDMLRFNFVHIRLGAPAATWVYRDETGAPLMVVARYDTPDGKEVIPWSWHLAEKRWVMRSLGYPSSQVKRPIYGLEKLALAPGRQVLIVEGEKTVDAAQRLVGQNLVVVGWPGGAMGIRKVDWTPLVGRPVVLVPDADLKRLNDDILKPYEDQPGARAMQTIGELLVAQGNAVKVVNVGLDETRADGWDLADAEAEGWDWPRLLAWIKERVKPWAPVTASDPAPQPAAVQVLQPTVVPTPEPEGDPSDIPALTLSQYANWERLNLATTKGGLPHQNVDNVQRFLANETALKDYLWYDDFHCKLFTRFDLDTFLPLPAPREWRETDEIHLQTYLQRHVGLVKMGLDVVTQGVKAFASKNVRNEPRDWMQTLTWDGTPRCEDFLSRAFGVEASAYTRAASRNWLTSIAARVLTPGCKVDTMLILRGEQGLKKSQALRALGDPWFAELAQNVESKDFQIALRGKLIVEIAELSAFTKSGAEAIKKMLSTQFDDYRPVFGKYNVSHPRVTVFAGSTNETFFLNDPTGARRFWPITCQVIDVDYIRENRDQIFAEAAVRVAEGFTWWEMPTLETREVQELHRQFDDWENTVSDWLHDNYIAETTVGDCANNAIGIPAAKLDRQIQMRIGRILTILGWANHSEYRDGRTVRVWRPKSA
jgi:putative DNA primase/helicase